MKPVLLSLVLMLYLTTANGTIYYSQGSQAPNLLSSWNSNRLGGGSQPASFTVAGDQFVIQPNHIMYTSNSWTVGSTGSIVKIESGAYLYGAHTIFLTGSFQISAGGMYYHDNTGPVSSAPGSSIFGGTEQFDANANIEIRNWINNTTPLPNISWGNLVINYTDNIGGNWNQQSNLVSVQGNLQIKRTGQAGQYFGLTNNTNLSLNVGGNLEIDQGNLLVKDGAAFSVTAAVQVNGDIIIGNGLLDLGTADLKPNNELRFKGNLLLTGSGAITAQSSEAMLVANGITVQGYDNPNMLNVGFKIVRNSLVKLASPMTLGSSRPLVVAGTLTAGTNRISLNGGQLAVSGGLLNSSAKIDMKDGVCQVCQGNGTFAFATNNWCASTGDTGIFNFKNDTLQFNRSVASALKIGALNSKGKLILTEQAIVAFTGPSSGPAPNRGNIELTGNGTLSFDESSFAIGDAFYNGSGGWLVVGSPGGLPLTGAGGSIQVTGARNYNFQGINNYEFKSNEGQLTGNGLPSTITGVLKVNNSSTQGLVLSSAVTIATNASLLLEQGVIRTNASFLLTMNRNSILAGGSSSAYVDGPLRKIGEQNFTFPVGKLGRYSPVTINANGGGNAADVFTVEYYPVNPQVEYGTQYFQLIERVSEMEYWKITGNNNTPRQVRFTITPYSGLDDFPSLIMGYFEGVGWINAGAGTKTGTASNGILQVDLLNYGIFSFASLDYNTNGFKASLPVNFLSFTARRKEREGFLQWEVSADTKADWYEVLASTDNRNFRVIGRVKGYNGQKTYQYTDVALQMGTTYYRIRAIEPNGNNRLSSIAVLNYQQEGLQLVRVSPSVASQQTMLCLLAAKAQRVTITIVNAGGVVIRQLSLQLPKGSSQVPIDMSNWAPGMYYLLANGEAGRGANQLRLIKQ